MDHLSPGQVEALRRRLLEERERLFRRHGTSISGTETTPVEIGDRQDRAMEERMRTAELAGAQRDGGRLAAIERALGRMESGRYGLCEETGDPIPHARLEIDPTTRFTVEVQELLERLGPESNGRGPEDGGEAY